MGKLSNHFVKSSGRVEKKYPECRGQCYASVLQGGGEREEAAKALPLVGMLFQPRHVRMRG